MTSARFLGRLAASIALLTLVACSSERPEPQSSGDDAAPAAQDEKLVIGVMPKLIGIDYFEATRRGAEDAAKDLGVEVDFDGPVTNDVTLQAQMLETWISKKYDAIAIAPNDPDAIAPVLEKARKRGIAVITWDADAAKPARDFFVNQAANEAIAKTLLDLVANQVSPEAKYIILTGSLTAANQNIWMDFIEQYRQEAYPNMVNLSETPKATEEDQALATQVTMDVIKTYPDLESLIAITSTGLPGAAEGLRKGERAEDIFLTGLATPKTMREYVKDDTVREFALWNPEDLGYLSVYAAVELLRGNLEQGDETFEAGRIGEVQLRGDEILLGDPIIFDKDNIDEYDF
jgi:ABC-type sugar transport system substrate-binding protein